MKYCLASDCPSKQRDGATAEYLDHVAVCHDCGATLVSRSPEVVPRSAVPSAMWTRLGVTFAIPVLVILLDHVPLPFVDWPAVEMLTDSPPRWFDLPPVGIFSLGLRPVLSAYVLVELVALIVPRWRALRIGGPEGRYQLSKATLVTSVGLVVIEGNNVAAYFESIEVTTISQPLFRLATIGLLVAGTFVVLGLSYVVTRRGLGNGISVLLASAVLAELLDVTDLVQSALGSEEIVPGRVVLFVAAHIAIVTTLAWLLRRNTRAPQEFGLPICGVAPPLENASAMLILPATIASFTAWSYPGWLARNVDTVQGWLLELLPIAVLCWLFSALFNSPRRAAALTDGDVDALRRAHLLATLRSTFVVTALAAISLWCLWLIGLRLQPLVLCAATAVTLDLAREWKARLEHGDLVEVWPLHRLYAVRHAAAALRGAGIPFHLRSYHHRTLLQFFGPYIPCMIMVPGEHHERAVELLDAALTPSAPAA